jgi:hypothetical protein
MPWEPTNELRIAPPTDDVGKQLAIEELLDHLNEVIRELNQIKEELTNVGIEP